MVNISFPLEFRRKTGIHSLEIDIAEQGLTYRRIIEILAGSFRDRVYNLILRGHEIMAVIIVDNKRVDPNDRAHDGERMVLMLPLEGG